MKKEKCLKCIIFVVLVVFGIVFINTIFNGESMAFLSTQLWNREINNSNDEKKLFSNWEKAFQEVADAYYMRGINIQYNSEKISYYSPEEATSQNLNHMVCSGFARNVYYELFGIKIPPYTYDLLEYGKNNLGNAEVIGYASKNGDGDIIMNLYDPTSENNYRTIENPELKEIIPCLKVGDILTSTGHTILIYDLIYDKDGKVVDAYILNGTHGAAGYYVKSKIPASINIDGGKISFGSANHYLYYNNKTNKTSGVNEGSISLNKLTNSTGWKSIHTKKSTNEYSILRFVQSDNEGKIILKYQGADYKDKNYSNEEINLSDADMDRIKFSKLYIEKIVDAHADNIVEVGDKLTYTITIKNNSTSDYSDDITVTEKISKYVDVFDNGDGIIKGDTITWNIGKLTARAEKKIKYTVTVRESGYGKIITSEGKVGNIATSVVKNTVGKNLTNDQVSKIKLMFNNLKDQYNGKELINEIYKQALGIDLKFDKFNITDLVKNTKMDSMSSSTLSLNQKNNFYAAVLNKYWSTLYQKKYTYNDINVIAYDLKLWRSYDSQARRADTIYGETFKTGDILIYQNTNDVIYEYKNNTLTKTPVTYEDGEYAYIFIEGQGFVGVNLGKDLIAGTIDDRNEFNSQYYKNSGLSPYSNLKETNEKILEYANYQTLFGKDYYVILRPSLLMPDKIEVTVKPTKINYIQNYENLDLTGGILTVTYPDNSVDTVNLTDKNVIITGFNNSKVGENTITVSYGGKTTTFKVKIIPKQISKIRVTTKPIKANYIKNYEKLDLTGGVLTVSYTDSSVDKISLTNGNVTVTGFDNSKVGKNTITVSYGGKTTTFKIEIISKQVSKIGLTTNLIKTNYIQNYEMLDLTGGILTVTYTDNSVDKVSLTNENVKVSGFDNSKVGESTITVLYSGKTTTFKVMIVSKQISKIEVTTNPIKLNYVQNYEKLDLTGGILTITYTDNSVDTISLTNENVTVSMLENSEVGENTITVSYGGKIATFKVKIISQSNYDTDSDTKTEIEIDKSEEDADIIGRDFIKWFAIAICVIILSVGVVIFYRKCKN